MNKNTKMLALKLLDRFDKHISTQLLLLHYNRDRNGGPSFCGVRGPTRFTGLHGAAFLGIARIFSTLLEIREWDVNAYDCMGMTALTWAARRGHGDFVTMLLQADVNPHQADTEYCRTPLWWAVEKGYEGVVRILLEREDVNTNQAYTGYGAAPLSWAAASGHEGVVKMLLEREDVNPNQTDTGYGRTPLSWADVEGHERVVELLLERNDVHTATPDYGCQTSLSLALCNKHAGVVRILERNDANSDAVSCGGQISLPP